MMGFRHWISTARIQRAKARWLYSFIAIIMAGYAVILWCYPTSTVMALIAESSDGVIDGHILSAGYAFSALVLFALRPPMRIIASLMLPHVFYTVFAFFWWISSTEGASPLAAWSNLAILLLVVLLALLLIEVGDEPNRSG